MGYFWLAVIAISIVPAAAASLLLNPLVFLVLGPEKWREQLVRALTAPLVDRSVARRTSPRDDCVRDALRLTQRWQAHVRKREEMTA